jgi:MerR family transcriptional regulator/heat shock protein HspR
MYERKGLVQPARTEGRARRYSDTDIERIRMIQWLTQEQGVNLAGVEMLLEMNNRLSELQRALDKAMAEIERLRSQRPDGDA